MVLFVSASILGVFAVFTPPVVVRAQGAWASVPVELPDGPAKPGFDIERFRDVGSGWFETYHVDTTEPLRQALLDAKVDTETLVMVLDTASGPLALLTAQMAFHHIAQGSTGGKDWMATF